MNLSSLTDFKQRFSLVKRATREDQLPTRHNSQPNLAVDLRRVSSNLEHELGPLPPYTAVIGRCEDGLPLLLDLSDPAPGAILISGPNSAGSSRLLNGILTTAIALNNVEDVQIHLVTPNLAAFEGIQDTPHCQNVLSSYDKSSSELIIQLAELLEQRRTGRHLGAANILAIDNLGALLRYNEYDVIVYLAWLLEHGPINLVWPMMTLNSADINSLDKRILSGFGTHLSANSNVSLIPDRSIHQARDNHLNSGFSTNIGGEIVSFSPIEG